MWSPCMRWDSSSHQSSLTSSTAAGCRKLSAVRSEVKVAQSCLSLCDPMDYIVHGILQARILEWVAFSSPEDLPNPGIEPRSPALQADSLPTELWVLEGSPDWVSSVKFSSVTQSCLTLCDPMACSMPGFPVHHQLLEPTQTHAHWVGDAIQPSHLQLSPSLPAFNLS